MTRPAFFALCAILASFTGCASNNASTPDDGAPTLRIATDAAFPPFHFIGDDGEPTGHDVELAKLAAQRAGYRPHVIHLRPYADLLGNLGATHDVVAATTGVTPERQRDYRFTRPYFQTCQAAIVRAGENEPHSLAALRNANARVGAPGDGTAARALRNMSSVRAVHFTTTASCLEALHNGHIDAMIVDEFEAVAFAGESDGALTVLPQPVALEQYALVVPRNRPDLQRELNDALAALEAEGVLAQLRRRFNVHRPPGWPVQIEPSAE